MEKDFSESLYPDLPPEAAEHAQRLVDRFKEQISKAAEDVIRDFYCDVTPHVMADHWINYRSQIMDAMCNYSCAKSLLDHDFIKIRKKILDENREEIIKDLDQDNLREIERLKELVEYFTERN